MRADQKWSEEAYGRMGWGEGKAGKSQKKNAWTLFYLFFLKHKTTMTLDRFGSYWWVLQDRTKCTLKTLQPLLPVSSVKLNAPAHYRKQPCRVHTCSGGRVSQGEHQKRSRWRFKNKRCLSCWLRQAAAGSVLSPEKAFCMRRSWKIFWRKPTFDCQHLRILDTEVYQLLLMQWCGCWVRITILLLTFFSIYLF